MLDGEELKMKFGKGGFPIGSTSPGLFPFINKNLRRSYFFFSNHLHSVTTKSRCTAQK
jgi:hypothetical protein